jgi:F0F1-type ATP synthase beta subunit
MGDGFHRQRRLQDVLVFIDQFFRHVQLSTPEVGVYHPRNRLKLRADKT